eukprot:scaffold64626_cov27-Tisochrysis_lutea.AAC.1
MDECDALHRAWLPFEGQDQGSEEVPQFESQVLVIGSKQSCPLIMLGCGSLRHHNALHARNCHVP